VSESRIDSHRSKPKKKRWEDEEEPEKPITGYDYDKFRDEALIFVKGALSANKLSRMSRKIITSKTYD